MKHDCYAITSKRWRIFILFFLSSIFLRERHRKDFHTITCINLTVVWVFLSRRYIQTSCWHMDCTCESILMMLAPKIGLPPILRYQPSQVFRTANLSDFENSTFDAANVSFYYKLFIQADFFDCRFCVKNYVSYLFHLLIQCKYLTLSSPYMQSNSDVLLAKIEQSTVIDLQSSRKRKILLDFVRKFYGQETCKNVHK